MSETHIREFIARCYSELPRYSYKMRDLHAVGLQSFSEDLQNTREWDTRVLALMQETRQLLPATKRNATHASRFYETVLLATLLESKNAGTLPGGMSAAERRTWAAGFHDKENADLELWEMLYQELRALLSILEDAHKDLMTARQDIRAQLWAMKLLHVMSPGHQHPQSDQALLDYASGDYAAPTHPIPNFQPPANPIPVDPEIEILFQSGMKSNGVKKTRMEWGSEVE